MPGANRRLIVIAGVAIVAASVILSVSGDLSRRVPVFLAVFGLMFAAYIAGAYLLARRIPPGRWSLFVIVVVAAAARAALVGSEPALSDDVYRYLWEGRVVRAGHNPFSHAPDSGQLAFLRDPNFEKINHKHLETIYPPLAQGAFLLGAVSGGQVMAFKILFVLFDLATLTMVILLLLATGRNPNLSVIYAWSPLVIVEFAHSGHMDSLGIFLLILALYLFERNRKMFGFLSMAMSFLAKYLSIALIPFFVTKKKSWAGIALFVAVAAVGYVPFAGASSKLLSSLGVYGQHWEFNSLLFSVLHRCLDHPQWIRRCMAMVVVVFAFYQGRRQTDLVRYTYLVIALGLLLSPTVYPWYLCWIVPFLCFHTNRAWLYLTAASALSYTVWPAFYETGMWYVSWTVLVIEYVPFGVLLLVDKYRSRQVVTT